MKIVRVAAHALAVRASVQLAGREMFHTRIMNHVEIETDEGLVGHGAAGHTEPLAIAALIEHGVADLLVGADPMCHEALVHRLETALVRRGQSGLAWHAISALDTALWDLKGKILRLPLWRLLGGARPRLPLYATFGLPELGAETIGAAAAALVEDGFTALKMVVGGGDPPGNRLTGSFSEDVARVRAVREAVGEDVDIFVSAQCQYSLPEALRFAQLVEPYNMGLFQEPTVGNDPADLAILRNRTGVPITLGHSLGGLAPFRECLVRQAVDYVQPNVVSSGGFTTALRIAALARAFGIRLLNGGGWLHHNVHLHAGLSNSTLGEWFPVRDIATLSQLYDGLQPHDRGFLTPSESPGLGFEPKPGALERWTTTNADAR